MQLIQHIELGSAQSSITFSSIPGTYTDLVLVTSLRSSGISSGNTIAISLNGSTSNFSGRFLYGTGSGVGSYAPSGTNESLAFYNGSGDTANTFSNARFYICTYTASTAKSISIDSAYETNATNAYQGVATLFWNNTAAITSIGLSPQGGANWVSGSSATLYGILKGSSGGVTVS